MDSGSPRSRVDQFFASKKKRKTLSPPSKSGRPEKEAKIKIEGSPDAKGSLESFLVTSWDGDLHTKPLNIACDPKAKQAPTKRNLTLEIGLSSKAGNKVANLSSQAHPQSFEAFQEDQRGKSNVMFDTVDVATRDYQKDSSESKIVAGNSELKQFANDFLSMYCCDVPSTAGVQSEPNVSMNKRQEEKSSKKKHLRNDGNQSIVEQKVTSSDDKNPVNIQSTVVSESGDVDSKYSQEVIGCNNPTELQASMRKCRNASALCTTACDTPGSLTTKLGARQTPQKTRRSSIFSPGEEFWNEAIVVADGLFASKDSVSSHVAENAEAFLAGYEMNKSNNVKNVGSCNALNKALKGDTERISAAGSLGKHGKDLNKEVSPLPVKHFDFSSEEKQLDKETSSHDNNTIPCTLRDEEKRCASTSHHGLPNNDGREICCKVQTHKISPGGQGMTTKCAISQRNVEFVIQNSDSFTSDTPEKECSKFSVNHEPNNNITPSSFSSIKDWLDLSNWLHPEICCIYKKKGILKLYPWQVDCLQVDGVLQNRNLVYCASTSAGKSFVAEVLMLRRVVSTGKMALLVLPYVSICAEKAEHLEVLLEPLDKHVRSYYGNQGGGTLPKDTSVAVCTIEKANSLINRLLEEGRLSELGIIVIDELHMVGDQSRGYLLELMLTKLRYAAGEGNVESSSGENSSMSSGKSDTAHGLQIVGMSATLPNVAAVADWLQAALYQTDFRPVPLEEYIKVGNTIYNKEMELVRTLPKVADLGGKDPDQIVELCNEVVQEGHSVLIFCSSRKGCESTSRHVAKYLKKFSVCPHDGHSESIDVTFAIDALRRSPAGLDPVLEETLPLGVAYHHAGLTVEERETVETCYRKGLVRVLTATSTLAAGVNLPARRVIFRQPRIGRDFIDGTRYKQMAGRAGRTGIDTKGESVLICKPEEVKRIFALLNDGCPPLHSCLSDDKNGMTHAILEVVAGGIVQSASDINRYVRCTLLNSTKPFEDVVKSAQDSLRWLCHKKFLEWSEETKLYTTTPLGRASFGSSLSPEESLIVLDDLIRAREGFVLASDLHLVYLVTPINVDVEPDWELYYERFMQLPSLDQSVGNRVGVQEHFLMRMAHGAPIRTSHRSRDSSKGLLGRYDHRLGKPTHGMLSDDQMLRVCRRFYVALILSRLVQEVPVAEVCEAFKVARGMVQALQENAGRFASMVTVFCERLSWHDLEGLVAKFQNRVSFGVRAEIVELTTIPYIKGSRARALYKAGLRTPQAIAEASVPEIVKVLFETSSWATQSSAQRRIELGVAKKIKNGARKIVLDKAEEARVAAFSAFKSLGLKVPEFSRPLLSAVSGDAPKKESTNSSGEESTSSFAGLDDSKHVLDASSFKEKRKTGGVISETEEGKSTVTSTIGLASSVKGNPAGTSLGELVEKPALLEEGVNTLGDGLHSTTQHINDANTSDVDNKRNESDEHVDNGGQQQPERENMCRGTRGNELEMGPVNATSFPGGFDSFLDLWDASGEFYFDIHFTKRSELSSIVPFEIHGMAVCWEDSPVYYLNFPKDLCRCNGRRNDHATEDCKYVLPPKDQMEIAKERWNRIGIIMGKKDVKKLTWNLKFQIQVLKRPAVSVHRSSSMHAEVKTLSLDLIENSYYMLSPIHVQNAVDMCIVAWILSPDEEKSSNPSLEKEVKKRLSSDAAAAANRNGRWNNQMRRVAHNGCCRRAAQTRALHSVLWKLLVSEELIETLVTSEIPLVNVLADMEICGIGVDMERCLRARHILRTKLKYLEKEAYQLAGMKFSLSMSADIANILYGHLKLPKPEGYEGKLHPSTDKHCLDMLRNEHPIVPVIKEHRTLAKLLNSTLGSICSLARLSMRTQKYTLHGHWLQTSTATGRLSMEEPNLQCVEHMVEFKINNNDKDDDESGSGHYKINARDFFVPTQDDWLLLTADYSQIELRMMAHFSKDSLLVELLSDPQGDIFAMIAAKWTGKDNCDVTSQERNQTKRLVYGILYGMGPNTLAEQLDCSSNEAAEKIQTFKKSFPGVASWLEEAVKSCRKKGFIKTLKGRKRFLTKIKFGNSKEKSKAQRQAVNSICQVHDELVLETDPSVVKEAGLLLQTCMESAMSLLVPLPVKLKVGRTWGSLEPFMPEKCNDDVTLPGS
ncbi:helicase and polymerase-containing protein TEBICHI-like isoform X2 [Olea europaea var. sylvestris]|uniref:helicase and polymerase-containing protein TEBICHI-like isoform X2 n=1 Tax=Olea europaea var. sylvestris TaxID=158386 RepID=UPI000C1D89F1|nr:helicase and polymerase-containing protein TEBICHI-like isoform X2 [Olea europaea var. sylvestris]